MLFFFTNLGLMEFQVGCLTLFRLSSGGFVWFWIGSFRKNIQIMLVFPKARFLVLLRINDLPDDVSVILLSVLYLSILLPTLSVVKRLIFGSNQNLTYEALWTGTGSDLLISILKNLSLFHFTNLIASVLQMRKQTNLFLRKSNIL